MIRLFCGYDSREAIGFHVFASSVIRQSSRPVFVSTVSSPLQRDGSNAFTYSRFLVPHLCGYKGWAIFADGCDMLCRGDIAKLAELYDPALAVQVVQHDYKTKHPRKYIGTAMEADNRDYPRKNWSSLMLMNCAHYDWRRVTPAFIAEKDGLFMHGFGFTSDRFIGALPVEWNWLVDEHGLNDAAQILHWTAGVPGFDHYKDAPYADLWRREVDILNYATR